VSRPVRAATVVFLALCVLLPASATARLPAGFAGVVPQGPLSSSDLDRIGEVGLGLRVNVAWTSIEVRPGVYDFSALDAQIGAAADRGIEVLPMVYGTPAWLRPSAVHPPLGRHGLAAWHDFLFALVARYGHGGSFWESRERRRPPRRWQLWIEPNFPNFWRPRPAPTAYAKLLHAGAAGVRAADRRARVVAAGLAPIERQPPAWEFLRRLYRVPGFRVDADLIALHPYSTTVGLLAQRVERMRAVMAAAGDARKPLLITEFGVASSSSIPTTMDRGPLGQARYLERAFARLARERRWRVAGAYWYAFADNPTFDPGCQFCSYTGLFDTSGEAKPAWWALKRVLATATR